MIRPTCLAFGAVFFCALTTAAESPLSVTNLRCEYKTNPIGIDIAEPRFSWEVVSSQRGTTQTAYQIRIALTEAQLAKSAPFWDSSKQPSEASIHVFYKCPTLETGQRYYWQVQVWDNHGNASGWSKPAYWEMGLPDPSDWNARWIRPNLEEDFSKSNPAPMLRRAFR